MPVAISTARLEARISTDLHSMLKRAAELQGRTMTDFVVAAVQDAAQRAIEQGVAFVPGAPFFCAQPDAATFRLSFATAAEDKILEGVSRLARALNG